MSADTSWDDPSVLDAFAATAADYRARMALPSEPLVLTMPERFYPAGMTHDEFRATAGAAYLRQKGCGSVEWRDHRGVIVRRIQL